MPATWGAGQGTRVKGRRRDPWPMDTVCTPPRPGSLDLWGRWTASDIQKTPPDACAHTHTSTHKFREGPEIRLQTSPPLSGTPVQGQAPGPLFQGQRCIGPLC